MTHYVYTTARGLCRTVHAQTPGLAWLMACSRHSARFLLNLDGHVWAADPSREGARARDKGAEYARTLYFQVCLAEIPIAREEMPRLAAGKHPLLGLERLLIEYGLWDESEPGLTDLGRAFVAWIQGGAS